MRTLAIAFGALLSLTPLHSQAYDKEMHQVLGMRGALGSTGLNRVLREDLGLAVDD